jgi:DNA replicative helicase MCM subunit Mcm2 (Cdc46/Mcm family)
VINNFTGKDNLHSLELWRGDFSTVEAHWDMKPTRLEDGDISTAIRILDDIGKTIFVESIVTELKRKIGMNLEHASSKSKVDSIRQDEEELVEDESNQL